MELVTIGEAAQMLALNTSALRYYEDRGLVTPGRTAHATSSNTRWPAQPIIRSTNAHT
jgi:DNA-binding transcriptional MerR regulator